MSGDARGNLPAQNRWWVVAGAALVQPCIGVVYAWSAFTTDVTDPDGPYRFTGAQSASILSAGLLAFAVSMVIAGRLQARFGPRPVCRAGGLCLGAGYILGGLFGSTHLAQLICVGLIGGVGIGLAYVAPIAVGVKWFPDKKGAITGIIVAGFGLGAMFWVQLAGAWGNLLDLSLFGLPGVQTTFLIYGVVFATLVTIGSQAMVNPPEGWRPSGWTPSPPDSATAAGRGAVAVESGTMLRTPQFYALWAIFVGNATAGMMVVFGVKLFAVDRLGLAGVDREQAEIIGGTAMSVYAILNGVGRVAWGALSDRIGRKAAIVAMCVSQGTTMLCFYTLAGSSAGYVVGAGLIGFNFGGIFALLPAITADYFGDRTVGKNYGWVFLASGFAGIVGPAIGGYFEDRADIVGVDVWFQAFVIASGFCMAALVIALLLRPPRFSNVTVD